MKILTTALLTFCLAACGAATAGLPPGGLAMTARAAHLEARTDARSWDTRATLRYVEGLAITADGRAVQGTGEWRFHYTAPGKPGELMVRVTPLEMTREERAATSPPGYVLGDNALGDTWVDSPEAVQAVLAARDAGAPVVAATELLLVPTRPARWVVRVPAEGSTRWVVNAETGTVIQGGQ